MRRYEDVNEWDIEDTKMNKEQKLINEINNVKLIDKITALAFVIGVIVGIVIASLLHKYIAHPLGY